MAAARDAGATVAFGGNPIEVEGGTFMEPTVLSDVHPRMSVARDEIFGPVVTIMEFDNPDEAVEIANGIDYGLSASVWSRDFDTCIGLSRRIRAGTIWTNTFMDGAAELPFGGRFASPGWEGSSDAMPSSTTRKKRPFICIPDRAHRGGCLGRHWIERQERQARARRGIVRGPLGNFVLAPSVKRGVVEERIVP